MTGFGNGDQDDGRGGVRESLSGFLRHRSNAAALIQKATRSLSLRRITPGAHVVVAAILPYHIKINERHKVF